MADAVFEIIEALTAYLRDDALPQLPDVIEEHRSKAAAYDYRPGTMRPLLPPD